MEAVRLLTLLRVMLYMTLHMHRGLNTTNLQRQCVVCSSLLPLHLAIIGNDFPIMFPSTTTWMHIIGFRELKTYIKNK